MKHVIYGVALLALEGIRYQLPSKDIREMILME